MSRTKYLSNDFNPHKDKGVEWSLVIAFGVLFCLALIVIGILVLAAYGFYKLFL